MSKEKGVSFLAPLVVTIFLLIIAIGVFFVYQKSKEFSGQQKLTTTTQTAQTVEWSTYTNTKFGFKIDYPKNWIVNDSEPFYIYFSPGKTSPQAINIGIVNLSTKTDISNFIDSYSNNGSKQNIKIGNTDGFRVQNQWFLQKENTVYIFSLNSPEQLDILEKMILSFQFVTPAAAPID